MPGTGARGIGEAFGATTASLLLSDGNILWSRTCLFFSHRGISLSHALRE
jgi:hypothetical protein